MYAAVVCDEREGGRGGTVRGREGGTHGMIDRRRRSDEGGRRWRAALLAWFPLLLALGQGTHQRKHCPFSLCVCNGAGVGLGSV